MKLTNKCNVKNIAIELLVSSSDKEISSFLLSLSRHLSLDTDLDIQPRTDLHNFLAKNREWSVERGLVEA